MVKHLVENDSEGTDRKRSDITPFCVELKGDDFNEARRFLTAIHNQKYQYLHTLTVAQMTADFLGIKLEKVTMTEQMYAAHFESSFWHNEHHIGDLSPVRRIALAKLIREKGFKVVLGGEGVDEHFGGYPFFEADFLSEVRFSSHLLLKDSLIVAKMNGTNTTVS
jgi:asparagine synthetase B (glutamine-hydrolysing)